ncbi:MAG: insulinase family protein [Chloroflexota bacterium]|nr:MAG: peptidase M16 [Chloroflexota bacterium]
MTIQHGFELLREQVIPELATTARLYRHVKTGARLLSMINDDENKVFGISFATPPEDSTGLPHIMEHSVLGGSRKYPVKEPFVELVKGSLNTFINAFTFSDKTCYPVASQNVKDLYNLIDVYLDAVFYPRISPETLKQEGWHYELNSADEPLAFKGIVFNEMKGAYSSPENYLGRVIEQSLLPDTPYGFDSGGDPAVIPDLTYEQFKRFHDTYYHPSNAYIFFYGDDDPEERLRYLNEHLSAFEQTDVSPEIPLQPRFTEPVRLVYGYDAGDNAENARKAHVTVNWLLTEVTDAEMTLAMQILAYILIGTQASPLRKALIDSGLGENLTGTGLADDQREIYFSTGLKGVAPEDADRVEALILETLGKLAEDGIDPDMIEAALNTIEFRLRENNTGSFPRGIALMIRALSTWLYGGDPLALVAFEAPLNALKERLASGERVFEQLIRKYLLDNPHRTTVLLKPDPEARARAEAAERDRLDKAREAMTDEDVQRIIEETRALREAQEKPDSPEALATIPVLSLDDLDRENKIIPIVETQDQGATVLYHDLFTNGIAYIDLAFDLHRLPPEYIPYLSLFSRALTSMGTHKEDFVKLSQRIGRKTGGLSASTLVSSVRGQPESTAWLIVRGKGTMAQTDDLLELFHDVLLDVNFDNQERFRQLVLEHKAGLESSLVPGGHGVVNQRLRSKFTEADWVSEQMSGVSQLFFLRELAERVERDWPAVLEALEAMREILVNRAGMICNVTLDEVNWNTLQPQVSGFLGSLPANDAARLDWTPQLQRANEGLTIPAQVNYVAKGANLYELGYELHGSVAVINNYLRTTFLWERIRAQGGAYGGFSSFDSRSGAFSYISYRDPNLLKTVDNYDQAGSWLRSLELDQGELEKSIIGAIGAMDAYQLPDAKGFTSMVRYMTGETDEYRQKIREEVLSTSAEHFREFGRVLEAVKENGIVVVMGAADAIRAANEARGGNWLDITHVL